MRFELTDPFLSRLFSRQVQSTGLCHASIKLLHWYPCSDSNRETCGTPFERADFTKICLQGHYWSEESDSNRRLYCFADSCIGPLCHPHIVWCLWQDSNLHTQAYLACALARYKLASLPLSYRGKLVLRTGIEPA